MFRLLSSILVATFLAVAYPLMCAAAETGLPSPAQARPDEVYVIHRGDQLKVIVYGENDLSQVVTVLPNGTVSFPLIGEVHVGGLTQTQAGSAFAARLNHYMRAPRVSVALVQEGPLTILVLGAVLNPGKYELPSRSRLTDAIASAGGLGITDGSLPDARLATARDVKLVSLQKLLHDGDTTQNVPLSDEMTVYVQSPLTLQIQVLGAVDHPGDITVHEGDRLTMAIARAGNGTRSNADLNRITLRRVLPDGATQTTNINLYDVLKSGDINRDPIMQKNDLVYIPQSGGRNDRVSGAASILSTMNNLFLH